MREMSLTILMLGLTHCDGNDYATRACSSSDAPPVENFWAGSGVADVTFLAFGDTQYFLDASLGRTGDTKNDKHIRALNAVPSTLSWDSFGVASPVSHIRGVIIAGDLTQNGRDRRSGDANEYDAFVEDYGLCGNRKLGFPVFESYGNHDYFEWSDLLYRFPEAHPVVDSVSVRNPHRVGVVNTAPGTDGHYSWEWDNVHFVNVNLAPSDVDPRHHVSGVRDPRGALSFLRADLQTHVAGTGKNVVLISHYGPWETFEWDAPQIDAAHRVLAQYNVIAWLHGHSHHTSHHSWRGINIYNVGSPFATERNGGSFSVFRITNDAFYAGDAQWDPATPTQITFPAQWQSVHDL